MSSADIAQQLVEIAQEPDFGLPAGCPVVPLGHQSGTYWFIDVAGQVWTGWGKVESSCLRL